MAALAVTGIAISFATALDHSGPLASPGTVRTAHRPQPGGSVCGLPGMDRADAKVTVVPVTTWATVGTMAAPSARPAGPGRVRTDGLRSCYAHTATGAVFAVASFWATGSDPRLYRWIIRTNVAASPGRAQALEQSGALSNTGMSAQIAGFRVVSYRPTAATVDVALRMTDGQEVGFPLPLVWEGGDWKVQLAADGSPVFGPTLLQSLEGYTVWEAAS